MLRIIQRLNYDTAHYTDYSQAADNHKRNNDCVDDIYRKDYNQLDNNECNNSALTLPL